MGNFEAPAYIGSSSGLNLALNLGEMVQATVWNKAIPKGKDSPSASRRDSVTSPGSRSGAQNGSHAITMQELFANSAEPPSDELGRNILAAYFNQIHPRYPFLDPDEVWKLHGQRVALATTPTLNLTKAQRFGIFRLYMVYAIGAMLLQLTEKHTTSPPEVFHPYLLHQKKQNSSSPLTRIIELLHDGLTTHIRRARVENGAKH